MQICHHIKYWGCFLWLSSHSINLYKNKEVRNKLYLSSPSLYVLRIEISFCFLEEKKIQMHNKSKQKQNNFRNSSRFNLYYNNVVMIYWYRHYKIRNRVLQYNNTISICSAWINVSQVYNEMGFFKSIYMCITYSYLFTWK